MKFLLSTIMIFVFAASALTAEASLLFNEIAWMGTDENYNHEWIELYNDGSDTIDLSGWSVFEGGESLIDNEFLNKSIEAGQYLLLGRSCENNSITYYGISADVCYTGAMNNTETSLSLIDSENNTVHHVSASPDWPAGSNETDNKDTMNWNGSSWHTASPTPKAQNTSSGDDSSDNDDEENNDNTDDSDDGNENSGGSSSGGSSDPDFDSRKITINSPQKAFVRQDVEFGSFVRNFNGKEMWNGYYYFNMGDGTIYHFKEKPEFTHSYEYPGEYTVVAEYTKSYFETIKMEPDAVTQKTIKIIENEITISQVFDDGAIEIYNGSSEKIDLGGHVLYHHPVSYTIPRSTIVGPNKKLILSPKQTKIKSNPVSLVSPKKEVLYTYSADQVLALKKQNSKDEKVATTQVSSNFKVAEVESSFSDTVNQSANAFDSVAAFDEKPNNNFWAILIFIFLMLISCGVVYFVMKRENKNDVKFELGYDIVEIE